jgi:acyl-CoA synthetase (AMP-forming)/AMP-acid ligase II
MTQEKKPTLIGDILRRAAERAPGRTAIACDGRTINYADLDRAADRFAHAIASLGLRSPARLAVLASNRPEYAIIYFGAARAGAVLAHLSFRATGDDIVHMLEKAEVRAVVAEAEYLDHILGVRARLPDLRHILAFGAGGALPGGVVALETLLQAQPGAPPDAAIAGSDPFAINFTGGTTGLPKAVLASQAGRVRSAEIGVADFGLDGDDVIAITTPLFHTAGLFVWYQTAVALAARCAFMPGWDADGFIDLVEREGVTAAFLVPTQLNGVLTADGFAPERLASIRKLNFAGAPMPPTLFRRAVELLPWVEMTEHYGQSEAAPIAVRPPDSPPDKLTSVGRACDGVEIAIMDAGGKLLPPGETGDVVTRGAHLLVEYYGDPEQTAALYRGGEGWLLTGDIGHIDADGYLSLVDRSKDMIISGGENIYPTEIENALYAHDAVAECAVFGVPDDHWGEIPAAHVVAKPGASVTEEELIAHCAARIARYKRPRFVKFVDTLPRTAVGKIQKSVIREPYWRDSGRSV